MDDVVERAVRDIASGQSPPDESRPHVLRHRDEEVHAGDAQDGLDLSEELQCLGGGSETVDLVDGDHQAPFLRPEFRGHLGQGAPQLLDELGQGEGDAVNEVP